MATAVIKPDGVRFGDRVRLLPPHTHAGKTGRFVATDRGAFKSIVRKVELDDTGEYVSVRNSTHWERIK